MARVPRTTVGPRPPPPLLTRVLRTLVLTLIGGLAFVFVLSVATLCTLP